MSDLPLPGLPPNDPENRLSVEARQRIARAFLQYNLIRKRALSAIDLGGHWNTPQEHAEMRNAAMEAVRVVLRAEAEEYGKLGLPGDEFREIMRGRIEEAVYSLEFSHVQRDALEAEFLWLAHQEAEENPRAAESTARLEIVKSRSISNRSAAARVKEYLERNGKIRVVFAQQAGIGEQALRTLINTGASSPSTWATVAGAMNIEISDLLKP
jgi:hypothetical protein